MNLVRKILVFITLMSCVVVVYSQDIHNASYNGDIKTIKKLIKGKPELINSRNSYGRFPLGMAAQTGQFEVVKFLISKGADIKMNRNGVTALHNAAIYGGNLDVINLLLNKGADINAKTRSGETPLNYAVSGKQKKIAELLIKKGGEINLKNQNLTHLLNLSASGGIKKIVDLILKKGVNLRYRSRNGSTLLHSAAEGGITEFVKLLLSKGLKPERANVYGHTPLHFAAREGHREIIELFLKKGVNINIKTKSGKTPIHFAKDKGHLAIVGYLKNKGADDSEWQLLQLKGKYLDQAPPGTVPVIFSPDIISAHDHFEHSKLTFSPDYTEIFWTSDFKKKSGFFNLVFIKKENNLWSMPELSLFSKKYQAKKPVFSYDGKKLYYTSRQSLSEDAGKKDKNIWVVEKNGSKWGNSKPLGGMINTKKNEIPMSISKQGTLYFQRNRVLYCSKLKNGVFLTPKKINIKLKTGVGILSVFVDPDEKYMIIESRGGGYSGSGDLYVSYKKEDSSWTVPKNFGSKINTSGHERFPSVSPDGKYLFFLRVSDGSDFFWVDAKIIDKVKNMKYTDIITAMVQIIKTEGVNKAIALYWDLKQKYPDFYDFREQMLNYLGYRLLNKKKVNEAIEIFKLNVKVFPNSANMYDSLAEAYLKKGEKKLAIKNYEISLRMDPENKNAVKMINKLRK